MCEVMRKAEKGHRKMVLKQNYGRSFKLRPGGVKLHNRCLNNNNNIHPGNVSIEHETQHNRRKHREAHVNEYCLPMT